SVLREEKNPNSPNRIYPSLLPRGTSIAFFSRYAIIVQLSRVSRTEISDLFSGILFLMIPDRKSWLNGSRKCLFLPRKGRKKEK
ncbi:unnamed protein product, partial [Musa hybrid cultivar]